MVVCSFVIILYFDTILLINLREIYLVLQDMNIIIYIKEVRHYHIHSYIRPSLIIFLQLSLRSIIEKTANTKELILKVELKTRLYTQVRLQR